MRYAQISPVIPALRQGNWAWSHPVSPSWCPAKPGPEPRLSSSGPHTPCTWKTSGRVRCVNCYFWGAPPLEEECGRPEDPPAWGRLQEQRQNVSSGTRAPSPRSSPSSGLGRCPPSFRRPTPGTLLHRCSLATGLAWPQLGPGRTPLGTHPPLVLSPQRQILTSGGPRIRLQDQDAGPAGSSSQDLFQGLLRQKNGLEGKEGPQSWPGGPPGSEAGCSMPTSQGANSCVCSPAPREHSAALPPQPGPQQP